MADTVAFSTLDPIDPATIQTCSLCMAQEASLQYAISSDQPDFQQMDGQCCLNCATNLLAGLQEMQRARTRKNRPEPTVFACN